MGVDFQPGEEEGKRGSGDPARGPGDTMRKQPEQRKPRNASICKYRRDTGWEAARLVYMIKKIKTAWRCLKVLNK